MPEQTPRDWPADSVATSEKFAEWLTRCTDEERIQFVTTALVNAEQVQRAFECDWEGQAEFFQRQARQLRAAGKWGQVIEVVPPDGPAGTVDVTVRVGPLTVPAADELRGWLGQRVRLMPPA